MKKSAENFTRSTLAIAVALGLMACGSSASKTKPEQTRIVTTLKPNLSGFLKLGSTTTCLNGGARPCAILIRTEPKLSSEIVNADPTQGTVAWPREQYKKYPGDNVDVLCYVPNGQRVKSYEGNSSSKDWYKVAVPAEHILNPPVEEEVGLQHPSLQVITVSGKQILLAYAAIEWFRQSTPDSRVPLC